MARTFIRQSTQIAASNQYDDSMSPGEGLVTGSVSLESDLNSIRSMLKQLAWGSETGNWYDGPQAPQGSLDGAAARGLNLVNVSLAELEEKRFLFRRQNLVAVPIDPGANYVTLNVANGTAPTGNVANSSNAKGVIVSILGGEEFGSHSMALVSGSTAIKPKNLVSVRSTVTHDVLTTSLGGGQTIYGLLQVESDVADGDAFNDSDARVQLSFVYENASGQLVPAPISDIGGKSINYSYTLRDSLSSLPEDVSLAGDVFVDVPETFLMSDITLDRALDNQGSTPTTTSTDINVSLATGTSWTFRSGSTDLFKLDADGNLTISTSTSFDSVTGTHNFVSGLSTEGPLQIEATGVGLEISAGTIQSMTAADLTIDAGANLVFSDSNNPGNLSGLNTGVKLAASASTWTYYNSTFGDAGIMDALVAAVSSSLRRDRSNITITTDISAGQNVGASSDGASSTGTFPDLSNMNFDEEVEIYLNGVLLRPGTDSMNPNDVYPGDLVNGELVNIKLPFVAKAGTEIVVITYSPNGENLLATPAGNGAGATGGGDPTASYVVLSSTSSLSNERVLTAGTGISIVDNGPGGNVTISATSGTQSRYMPIESNHYIVWKFDELSGETIAQNSGTASGATLSRTNANVVFGRVGVFENSVGFTSTSPASLYGASGAIPNASQLSVSCWINPKTFAGLNKYARIISKRYSDSWTSPYESFAIVTSGTDGQWYAQYSINGTFYSVTPLTTPSAYLSLHQWNHVGVTYENSSGVTTVKLYLNGNLIQTHTQSPAGDLDFNTSGTPGPWVINDPNGTLTSDSYTGQIVCDIDDFRVINEVLPGSWFSECYRRCLGYL